MSTEKYPYLKKYIDSNVDEFDNYFEKVTLQEIIDAETALNLKFPSELKEFYLEIGCGFIVRPHNPPKDYRFFGTNRINAPNLIVQMFEEGPESGLVSQDFLDDMEPGDLPFFEISDSSSFMVMKTQSDNPNAVWYMGYKKIEDSLEQFIWNLYYKDPDYYSEDW
ncbi:MAG: SMI1/KNR4 family protein [Alphaproteobacteria bacterium]|jgi:hypothetical protein|nr:SMI1/KNR4 family protein [Alphaproteobacteria bacterium]